MCSWCRSGWAGLDFVGEAGLPESLLPSHPPQALLIAWPTGPSEMTQLNFQ